MADPILTQSITLMKDKRPSSCFIDQIYDPDKDGPFLDTDDFPRVIPLEGAIAIERDTGNIYYVAHVDETTYKSTLSPVKIVVEAGVNEEVKVISYGNDRFTLFVNKDHKPTRLTISSNFIIFGSDLVKYQLYRLNDEGKREVISIYLDSDENYQGEYIPLLPIMEGSPIKQATNCHTFFELQDGESITMDIYDTVGVLRMTIRLIVANETAINDIMAESDVIVGIDATALQQLENGDFYLYQKQDVSHLGIIPRLQHYNGQYEELAVDNKSTFVYGLEGFVPAFVGQRQRLIIKHFLGPKQQSTANRTISNSRFLSTEKWVVVMPNERMDAIKISLMPIWDNVNGQWYLKFIGYSDKRNKVFDATPYVKYIQEIDTSMFGVVQTLKIEVDLFELFGASATIPYSQAIYVKLFSNGTYQKYLISDTSDMSVVYGVESASIRRPIIFYDPTLEKYYIPTSRFRNSAAMLETFYYCATPPIDEATELSPPKPTHFTIRGLDNLSTLITAPIPIENFNSAWMINRTGNSDMLVGQNVIVEFLREMNSEMQILYGVPVDCMTTTTAQGYVGEPQPMNEYSV